MMKNIIRIIIRKCLVSAKFVGRRRYMLLLAPLVLFVWVLWPTLFPSTVKINRTVVQPNSGQSLHYRMNRNLEHYLQHIQVVIEPTSSSCETPDEVPVVILVASISTRSEQREAVRNTWGSFQPTYFLMGRYGDWTIQMVNNRNEANEFNDIIMFDFLDHDQNQTLKTALMMNWAMEKCPKAQYMLKTEDDVMVNPWMLNKVLSQNIHAPLIGYSLNITYLMRDEYKNRNIPPGLREDKALNYLSATGYLIRGDYIEKILKKAQEVPMVNLEDVYFTYLVAHKELGLTLTHDARLSPYKPWLNIACVYWNLACAHSFDPEEMVKAWSYVEDLVIDNKNIASICKFFNAYYYLFKDFVLY